MFMNLIVLGLVIASPNGAGLPLGATGGHGLTSRIPKVSSWLRMVNFYQSPVAVYRTDLDRGNRNERRDSNDQDGL
jgi:hypothetical protein